MFLCVSNTTETPLQTSSWTSTGNVMPFDTESKAKRTKTNNGVNSIISI